MYRTYILCILGKLYVGECIDIVRGHSKRQLSFQSEEKKKCCGKTKHMFGQSKGKIAHFRSTPQRELQIHYVSVKNKFYLFTEYA